MKQVTKKSTKISIRVGIAIFLTLLLTLSGVGIYFAIKKDKAKPDLIINPIGFSVDKWDGQIDQTNFVPNMANRGSNTLTIDSAESFAYFVQQTNQGETYDGFTVYLNKSIDLNGKTINPITNFKGTFDGGYYTIQNGTFKNGSLFTKTENAIIRNVGLYNCNTTGAGLITEAVNTDVLNVFVRAGTISGNTTAGLVKEFVSTNGNHVIRNSFVDSSKVSYGLVASFGSDIPSGMTQVGGTSLIETCYFTNSLLAAPTTANAIIKPSVIKAENLDQFTSWNYASDYKQGAIWCDYAYVKNSNKLEFNYPILSEFVKVYLTGSYYESVVTVNGQPIDDADSATLSEAVSKVNSGNAEINFLVEKITVNEEATVKANSTIVLNATEETTIIRGENNTGSIISSTADNSKIVLGNLRTRSASSKLIIDGNRDYVEANNLQSGALISSYNEDITIADNVVLQNNINNQTAGGAIFIYGDATEEGLALNVDIKNCSSTSDGGAICAVDTNLTISGTIANCVSNGKGGAVSLLSGTEAAQVINSASKVYGTKKVIRQSNNTNIVEEGTLTINTYTEIYNNRSAAVGGGIYCTGLVTEGDDYILIYKNWAQVDGGGIYCAGSAMMFNTKTVIDSNQTGGNGGGIYATDVNISNNILITENEAMLWGGGLYITSTDTSIIDSATLSENTAKLGGAAYSYGQLNIFNTIIKDNTAEGGAGVKVEDGKNILIANGEISGNKNTNDQGDFANTGIISSQNGNIYVNYVSNSDLYPEATETVFTNNETEMYGILWAKNIYAYKADFSNNKTAFGAAAIAQTHLELNNCTVNSNISGEAAVESWGSITITDSTISSNNAAGVYVNGKLIVNNSTIANNANGGIYSPSNYSTLTINNSTITSNKGYGSICVRGATLCINGSTIVNNTITAVDYYNTASTIYINYKDTNNDGTPDAIDTDAQTTVIANNKNTTAHWGVIYGSHVYANNINFTGNNSIMADETIVVSNSRLTDNETALSNYNGGAEVDNCEINNNDTAIYAGAINDCSVKVTNSTISNNNRAIYVNDGGSGACDVTVTNSTISNNTSSYNGAAISGKGKVTIQGSTLNNNRAANGKGGAIYTNGDISIGNCTLTKNTSTNGGAVYTETGTVYIRGGNFSDNTATIDGGAVYAKNVHLCNDDGTIKNNLSYNQAYTNGGAIRFTGTLYVNDDYTGSNGIITKAVLSNNSASNGGAIYGATAHIDSADITNNTALAVAGAIHISTIVLTNSKVNNNTAWSNTGAINAYTATITSSEISNNYSEGMAGGINTANLTANGVTFANNTSNGIGSAIVKGKTSNNLVINNCTFLNNRNSKNSGAIYSNNQIKINVGSTSRTVFNGNQGGAIYTGQSVELNNVDVINNTSTSGAIYAAGVTIANSTISNNTSTGQGAGINSNGSLEAVNCSIINNKSNTFGGGVYAKSGATFTDSLITNNSAMSYGGGIASDSTLTLNNTKVINNTAKTNGAGVYAGDTYINNSTISSNTINYTVAAGTTTSVLGAGVYANNVYINYNSDNTVNTDAGKSTLSYNKAVDASGNSTAGMGGAIYTTGNVYVYNANVLGNVTGIGGGGIYANGLVEISYYVQNLDSSNQTVFSGNETKGISSTLESNKQGGGAIYAGSMVEINNALFNNNLTSADGGGAINSRANITVIDSTFVGNTAESYGAALYTNSVNVTNCNFSANNAWFGVITTSGGTINNSNITNNDSTAIESYNDTITLENTIVSKNSGKGLYVANANIVNSTITQNSDCGIFANTYNSSISVTNSTISYNGNGGIVNTESGAKTIINSSVITNNSTTDWYAGIYTSGTLYINYKDTNNDGTPDAFDTDAERTIIANNIGSINGGGIYGDQVYAYNTDISNNEATYGAGVMAYSNTILTNCNISNNASRTKGGAIIIMTGNLLINNCVLTNNSAGTANDGENSGGAIFAGDPYSPIPEATANVYINYKEDLSGADTTLGKTIISNNMAGYIGGAIYSSNNIYAYNVEMNNNQADFNGAVSAEGSVEIAKALIKENTSYQGAVYFGKNSTITDTEIVDNNSYGIWTPTAGLTLTGSNVSHNNGAIEVYYDSIITDSTISNNNGFAVVTRTGKLTIDGVNIFNNTVTSNTLGESATIYASGVTVKNSTISNNSSTNGYGGIYSQGDVNITSSKINENTSALAGGAIYSTGKIYINYNLGAFDTSAEKTEINGNNSSVGGGAIYTEGAVYIFNADISNNRSAQNGGAINTEAAVNFYIDNVTMQYNSSSSGIGGAIYSKSGVSIAYVNDSDISYNYAAGNAGAMHIGRDVVTARTKYNYNTSYGDNGGAITNGNAATITNCEFVGNKSNTTGGAIRIGGTANIINSTFFNNQSGTHGGAIYASTIRITGGTISNNKLTSASSSYGGGAFAANAYFNYNSTTDADYNTSAEQTLISDNTAINGSGGGLYVNGTAKIYNVKFSNNLSKNNAGAIFAKNASNINKAEFIGNTSTSGVGGSIYSSNNLQITDSKFADNTALQGGAIYANNGLTSTSTNYSDNEATDGNGGAIYINGGNISILGGEFGLNSASSGGAIFANCNAEISSAKFVSNTANAGGAVYVYKDGLSSQNTNYENNTATVGSGGAILVSSGDATFINDVLTGNTAKSHGGAVYVYGNLDISTVTATNNSTQQTGGAIYVLHGSSTVVGGVFDENKAYGGSGGAILNNEGSIEITGGSYSNNYATSNGGAIYSKGDVYINTNSSGEVFEGFPKAIISNNTVNSTVNYAGGGGISTSGKAYVYNTEMKHNTVTDRGGAIKAIKDVQINNSVISENYALKYGGAIFADTTANISIISSTLSYNVGEKNSGGAVYGYKDVTISGSTLNYNMCNGSGGAIKTNGTVTVARASVLNYNTAGYGGAILCDSLVASDATFTGNQARNDGGAVYLSNNSSFDYVDLTNNMASRDGGAIYQESGTLSFTRSSQLSNNAAQNNGGAIYTCDDVYETENDVETLTSAGVDTIEIDSLSTIYSNIAKNLGDDVYIGKTGGKLSLTKNINSAVENKISVYINGLKAGDTILITLSDADAVTASGILVLENNVKVGANAVNVIALLAGYKVTISPNGGDVSYTYGETTTELTGETIILYANYGSNKLYNDESLTEEVTTIKFFKNGYTYAGLYTAETEGYQVIGSNKPEFNVPWFTTDINSFYAQYTTTIYSITYNLDGGYVATNNVCHYTIEDEAIIIANPTKDGYTFIGWTGTGILTDPVTELIIEKGNYGDKTYTANWELNKYDVTFKNADEVIETIEVEHGNYPIYTKETPVKADADRVKYTFVGWSNDGGKTIVNDLSTFVVKSDVEFTAQFTESYANHVFTIVTDNNGSVSEETLTTTKLLGEYEIVENDNIITIDGTDIIATANAGYMFSGWVIEPNHTTETTTITANFIQAVNITINVEGASSNTYGVILLNSDNKEIARYSSSFSIPKGSEYKVVAYSNLVSNPINNSYQILTISATGTTDAVYDSYTTSWINSDVKTNANAIENEMAINFVYTNAYIMQVRYSYEDKINGIASVTADKLIKSNVDKTTFIIEEGATVNFSIDANADNESSVFFYSGLSYKIDGRTHTQGKTEGTTYIQFVGNPEINIYTYTTTTKIAELIINIFEGKVHTLPSVEDEGGNVIENPTYSQFNIYKNNTVTKLTLTSEDGHVKNIIGTTTAVGLYSGTWTITLTNLTDENNVETNLQEIFGDFGVIEKSGDNYILTIA